MNEIKVFMYAVAVLLVLGTLGLWAITGKLMVNFNRDPQLAVFGVAASFAVSIITGIYLGALF